MRGTVGRSCLQLTERLTRTLVGQGNALRWRTYLSLVSGGSLLQQRKIIFGDHVASLQAASDRFSLFEGVQLLQLIFR